MKNLTLLENKIAFEFLEDTGSSGFSAKSSAGIIVNQKEENQVGKARWGKVIKQAKSVTEVSTGDYILVEPMGWTLGLKLDEVEEETFWITTEDRIMAVTNKEPTLI